MMDDNQRRLNRERLQGLLSPAEEFGRDYIVDPINKLAPGQFGDVLSYATNNILPEFSPGVDIKDMIEGSRQIMGKGGSGNFDIRNSLEGLALMGLGTIGLVPGFDGVRVAGKEALQRMSDARKSGGGLLDDEPLRRWAEGHNGGPLLVDSADELYDTVDLPPGSKPAYVGSAPDRSGGSYPRYNPKNTPPRMQRLMDAASNPESPILKVFDDKIRKGLELKGDDWYNTEELRDWFVQSLGEAEGGRQWFDFMEKVGAGSTGSKVPENIRIASFFRALGDDAPKVAQYVKDNGGTPRAAMKALNIKEPPNMPPQSGTGSYNYGHLKQRNHAGNIINQDAGKWQLTPPEGLSQSEMTKWLQANPKVKGFKNSLLGNKENIAADMHFMRLMGMSDGGADFLTDQASLSQKNMDLVKDAYGNKLDKYIVTREVKGKKVSTLNLKKAAQDGVITDTSVFSEMPSAWTAVPSATEYAAYEKLAQQAAKRYNLTPAQFQAALWMGAGDLTNLADESQGTFMELFRRSLDKRAGERGITRREMLDDFITNKAPLSIAPIAGAGLLGAGMMRQEEQQPQQGILN